MAAYVTNLPVNGTFNVTATFGQTGSYWPNGHKGIDITASQRTLYAICDGEVTVIGWDPNGWGRYVSVKPTGFERIRFITCHMVENSVKVKKGGAVSRLTALGTMGSSGNSTGVHVHIEMRIDNKAVDPTAYLLIANKKASGLSSANYKFDAACQKTALAAILDAYDKNAAMPNISTVCSGGTSNQAEIERLKNELAVANSRLFAAETKIANAIKALE